RWGIGQKVGAGDGSTPDRTLSRPLKKTHLLRCAQSPRSNVLDKYAFARRSFVRLASEIFLSSLATEFFI
ncbi:MAG TPA: hypothetical protein VFL31_03245, partial [Nitrospiraceae bacterium]|nr:hypothetical protein [Nitrospiraceae bacterium]